MSVKVMSWVWEHSRSKSTDRLVLLAIADCAADDGANAYPSMAKLVAKTGLTDRAIQKALSRLEAAGELVVGRNAGPRGCNRYRVRMATPEPSSPSNDVHPPEPDSPEQGSPPEPRSPQPPNVVRPNPEPRSPGTVLEPSVEPSVRRRAPRAAAEETNGQRVNRLAKVYTDRVKLSNFNAVAGVVRKAVNAGVDDEKITNGLSKLADDSRSVTTDSLRYAIYGVPPSQFAGNGHKPYTNPTDPNAYREGL